MAHPARLHLVNHCDEQGLPSDVNRTLMRRYYLVEKARNASIVGILVGTLGAAGYLQAVDHVRKLAQRRVSHNHPDHGAKGIVVARFEGVEF